MKKEKNGLLFNLLLLTIFFNVWFPKAGIKFSGIPLTVGNILFAITFILWIIKKEKNSKISKFGGLLFISILYFIFKYIIICTYNGIVNYVTYIIPLIIYPFVFYMVYDMADSEEKIKKATKIFVYGFFFCCLYSLLQFLVGIERCDIPGLTVNLTDYQILGEKWFMAKSNGLTEANSKIVSTYQNGNLFGVNMLLFYPLIYNYLKNVKKNIIQFFSLFLFIMCVFLSLSRACWLGVLLFLLFSIISDKNKTKASFLKKMFIISFSIIMIIYVMNSMPSVANRFFNTDVNDWISMSGRTEGLFTLLKNISISGNLLAWIIGPNGIISYYGLSYEMLPASLLAQSGLVGIILIYGLFFRALKDLKEQNLFCDSIRLSIIIWLIIGLIECGYWLPPTALNIFIILGFGYASKRNNNSEKEIKI